MPHFQLVGCRIKIQVCVGHFPDGRMRTRTFGIKNVRPDVSADDVAAVARAIGALLAHPIVCVRLVRNERYSRDAVPRRAASAAIPQQTPSADAAKSPALFCSTFARKGDKLLSYRQRILHPAGGFAKDEQ